MRHEALLLFCLLLILIFPYTAQGQEEKNYGTLSLYWENDYLAKTDSNYTNGGRLTWTSPCHMALHARCVAVTAARGDHVEKVAHLLVKSGTVKVDKAKEILASFGPAEAHGQPERSSRKGERRAPRRHPGRRAAPSCAPRRWPGEGHPPR